MVWSDWVVANPEQLFPVSGDVQSRPEEVELDTDSPDGELEPSLPWQPLLWCDCSMYGNFVGAGLARSRGLQQF